MGTHKGLNIKVGDRIFRSVERMDRCALWQVQDGINAERERIQRALQGNISAATRTLLQKQDEGLRKRFMRTEHLIRSLPVKPPNQEQHAQHQSR